MANANPSKSPEGLPLQTSPQEQLISPDHRRRLLEQATKQFRRRRAFSVLNFASADSSGGEPEQQQPSPQAWKGLPFPIISPDHREKLLQRATDTLKRHRTYSLLREEGGPPGDAPPSVVDLWREGEKRENGQTVTSRTDSNCVQKGHNTSTRSSHEP